MMLIVRIIPIARVISIVRTIVSVVVTRMITTMMRITITQNAKC